MSSAETPKPRPTPAATERWQRRLLPFMIGGIAVMGVFFFAASLWQLNTVQQSAAHTTLDLAPVFADFERRSVSPAGARDPAANLAYLRLKTALLLENDVVTRRYHQANSAMLARVWTRYLGFVTGMILALVGAIFVLGKLREDPTSLEAETGGVKGSLTTSSPGILLACLGAALMIVTLTVTYEVKTRDAPVYLPLAGGAEAAPARWPGQSAGNVAAGAQPPGAGLTPAEVEKRLFPPAAEAAIAPPAALPGAPTAPAEPATPPGPAEPTGAATEPQAAPPPAAVPKAARP